ncbi:hypothetical protein TL16_g09421 [Triparma laevis f. inornata]|uniref:RING-type domain-containing protein n=1 Tax=Triparma laevis f. inornata TaxID=1714386 RepID=A0A9W7B2T8_9STRA|nr:hypothetical protein TL16_g09421 [Triparma laevis f. inornata]
MDNGSEHLIQHNGSTYTVKITATLVSFRYECLLNNKKLISHLERPSAIQEDLVFKVTEVEVDTTMGVLDSPTNKSGGSHFNGGATKAGEKINYCSTKHQEAHWKYHNTICIAPQKKFSAPVSSAPPIPLKGSVNEEEEYEDKCVICLDNVPDTQIRRCGHSAVCTKCTRELMARSQPCPNCRKPISSFEVGVYSGSLGEKGLWLTSARNISELVRNDGFNEYFQKHFYGNEATFLRWKEVFNVQIVGVIRGSTTP